MVHGLITWFTADPNDHCEATCTVHIRDTDGDRHSHSYLREKVAETLAPCGKTVTGVNYACPVRHYSLIYRGDIFGSIGTYAIGTLDLYYAMLFRNFTCLASEFPMTESPDGPRDLPRRTSVLHSRRSWRVADAPQGADHDVHTGDFPGSHPLWVRLLAAILKRFGKQADEPANETTIQ